jgi:hypothetical protein
MLLAKLSWIPNTIGRMRGELAMAVAIVAAKRALPLQIVLENMRRDWREHDGGWKECPII